MSYHKGAVPSPTYVYIAASEDRRLIVGIAKDLEAAMYVLRTGVTGWAAKLGVTRLVWFGACESVREAAEIRSKLRRMGPKKRRALIETTNPEWHDLLPPKVAAGRVGAISREVAELADLQDRVALILERLREFGIDPENPGMGGVGAMLPGWPDFPRPRLGSAAASLPGESE